MRDVAALARLRLSEEEELLYSEQLGRIVGYIDQLADYETLTEGPEQQPSVQADDVVMAETEREVTQEALLDNAPESLDTFVLVPQVKVVGDD